MDLSPMIDLVFLLLIFFMVSSTIITHRQDPRVAIPIASAGKVPSLASGRVLINVYADGSLRDDAGRELDVTALEARMRQAKAADPAVRLHVRADQLAAHRHVKGAIDASARGGVTNVIFSTYVTSK